MAVTGYGNAVYETKTLAGSALERQQPLTDQLRMLYEQLAMAHNALDELEQGPRPEKAPMNGPVAPEPYGVFDTAQRSLGSAMKLRERVQNIAQRIGRL